MGSMDLASLLGGGGSPAPAGPPPGGMAPEGPAPEASDSEEALPEIQDVLNMIQEMLAATQDPEEQAAFSAAESALTKLVLTLQKQKDAAMGTTPAHKFVARQQAGGGA